MHDIPTSLLGDLVTDFCGQLRYTAITIRQEVSIMTQTRSMRKARVDQTDCVACGCCLKVCPRDAIVIHRGLYAIIEDSLCIGCRKCAAECPASIIRIVEVEA